MHHLLFIALLLLSTSHSNLATGKAKHNLRSGVEIINVKWFDGKTFRSEPLYIVEGKFTFSAPDTIMQTIDARYGYLIPPFAEAHNHNIFPLGFAHTLKNYKEHGVLYAMSQGNICAIRDSIDRLVNHSQSMKELLKVWIEDTPKIIFPDRKIGRIAEGFEANFAVLQSNPLTSFEAAVQNCLMMAKQGNILYAK